MTESRRLALEIQPAAPFASVLVEHGDTPAAATQPAAFGDLNLDQVVEAITTGRDEYDLEPFFYAPLRDVDAVVYRHEVFHDLERDELRLAVQDFGAAMARVRRYLTLGEKQHYRYERERWFLDAASAYCDAVTALATALAKAEPSSRGFTGLADYLATYTRSDGFVALADETRRVLDGLNAVTYAVRINGTRVTVTTYEHEPDYSVEVDETFERFRQGAVDQHLVDVPDSGSMDHVEEQIVLRVARIFPREFHALEAFCERRRGFADPTLLRFDREAQFYLAYLELAERLGAGGVPFSYPTVSHERRETVVRAGVDLALAVKLGRSPVPNDLSLHGNERTLVVTGPNQGGKTTFARMIAQLHYLAALGVPLPARAAQLVLPDDVFSHFAREEDIATLRGRLDDELVRLREIVAHATAESVVVLNEIFASTTLADAVRLGATILRELRDRDCLTVCVTFVDQLAEGEGVATVVAQVAADDPSRRTFELLRTPADGRAYAFAIAEKYGLSYEWLLDRVRR